MTVQKEDVTIEHRTYEGDLIESKVEHRNVYRPRSGQPYINWLGGKRFLTSDNPPRVVQKPLSAPSDASFDATIGQFIRNLPPGAPVRVVGLL